MVTTQLQILQSPITSLISSVSSSISMKLDDSNYLTWHFQMELLLEGRVRLKEQFSIVTRATIFQMKSELQNIKKGTYSISLYLQRIKETRDYLAAIGVLFADDDIVILTLNGLSSEYNTLRSIIRGRENVISMKNLHSQLLVEEAMLANVPVTPFLSAMVASNLSAASKLPHFGSNSTRPHYSSNSSSSNGGSYSS
ncbi:unnamed protein product [Malus baccata var. baccata]